jgi:hypothetical protein
MTACMTCGQPIEWSETYDAWVDAGSTSLVYCNDQDETHDGQRHEPAGFWATEANVTTYINCRAEELR